VNGSADADPSNNTAIGSVSVLTAYSYVVPVDQNMQRMTVVGIVGFYETDTHQRPILNAVQAVVDRPIFHDGFENGGLLGGTANSP